jgi:hypothetical protein
MIASAKSTAAALVETNVFGNFIFTSIRSFSGHMDWANIARTIAILIRETRIVDRRVHADRLPNP